MLSYIIRRVLLMIPVLLIISVICFTITELQPGDFLSKYLSNPRISPEQIQLIKENLGLDKPPVTRYFIWISGLVRGDWGYSFAYKTPVLTLINERMGWTIAVALTSIIIQWILAFILGILSAKKKNTPVDYSLTFFSFLGISLPDFFLALLLMFLAMKAGFTSIGSLFSKEFIGQPMSFLKLLDLAKHLWLPVIVIGLPGVSSLLRVLRGNYIEMQQSTFISALKARGVSEKKINKHILKNVLNPMVSIASMQLPTIFSGTIITAIILNLPTMGPFFYNGLLNQDQYLVMGFLMIIAFITQLSNLLADILLAYLDPRISLR